MTSITSGTAVAGLALLTLVTGCATTTPDPAAPAVLHLAGYSAGTAQEGSTAQTARSSGPTPPPVVIGRPGSGYRLSGVLPTGPASAAVYRFPGQVPVTALRALTQALDLTAAPVRHAYGWAVSGRGGAQLLVRDDGAGQWSYVRQAGPGTCLPQVELDAAPAPGYGTACSGPAVPGTPGSPPAGPSAAVARAAAGPVLAAVGLSAPDATVWTGSPVSTVSADPVGGGLATVGLSTTVSVDRAGVVAAQGWLGTATVGAQYPLVTAEQALRSLSRMAHPMGGEASGVAAPAVAIACPMPAGPATPVCGGPTVITGARLGLALRYDVSAPVLVPAWLFSVAGDPTYPIVVTAVQPRYLGDPVVPPDTSGGAGAGTGSSAGPPTSVEPAPPGTPPGQPVGAGHGVGPG